MSRKKKERTITDWSYDELEDRCRLILVNNMFKGEFNTGIWQIIELSIRWYKAKESKP